MEGRTSMGTQQEIIAGGEKEKKANKSGMLWCRSRKAKNLRALLTFQHSYTHTDKQQLPVGVSWASLWPRPAFPAWPSASSPGSCWCGAGRAAASLHELAGPPTSAWGKPGCRPAPWWVSVSSCAEDWLLQAPGLWSAWHPCCCVNLNCNTTGANEQRSRGRLIFEKLWSLKSQLITSSKSGLKNLKHWEQNKSELLRSLFNRKVTISGVQK